MRGGSKGYLNGTIDDTNRDTLRLETAAPLKLCAVTLIAVLLISSIC
jgi:hypothetical protein